MKLRVFRGRERKQYALTLLRQKALWLSALRSQATPAEGAATGMNGLRGFAGFRKAKPARVWPGMPRGFHRRSQGYGGQVPRGASLPKDAGLLKSAKQPGARE